MMYQFWSYIIQPQYFEPNFKSKLESDIPYNGADIKSILKSDVPYHGADIKSIPESNIEPNDIPVSTISSYPVISLNYRERQNLI